MIGQLNFEDKRATVVGAGIAGLLAAYRLDQAGFEVTLYEAAPRAGGLIQTKQTPFGISERAAHSFLASSAVAQLCGELGVELCPVQRQGRAKYVLRGGCFRQIPLGGIEIFRTLKNIFKRSSDSDAPEMTLADWARRHLSEAALDYLLNPFVRGVYGAEPEELCVGAAFPQLMVAEGESCWSAIQKGRAKKKQEKAHGHCSSKSQNTGSSKSPPKSPMMAPKNGMGALAAALEKNLENRLGSRFFKNQPLQQIPDSSNVLLCVSAGAAARLLAACDPSLSEALAKIPYTPLVSATVFAHRIPKRRRGVGVLIPRVANRKALGVLFNSDAFPGRIFESTGFDSFTVILGGTAQGAVVDLPQAELEALITAELGSLFRYPIQSVHFEIHRHPHAIPQYGPVLLRAWERARQGWCSRRGQILFGNYTGEVSLRGMVEGAERFFQNG